MQGGVDSMMLEMVDGFRAQHRLLLGQSLIADYEDGYLFRGVEIWHRFGQCARRFPTAVPGDDDMVKGQFSPFRFRDEKEMPSGSEQNALDQPVGILGAIWADGYECIGRTRLPPCDVRDVIGEDVESTDFNWLVEAREALGQ
jgi:hypothetical protein